VPLAHPCICCVCFNGIDVGNCVSRSRELVFFCFIFKRKTVAFFTFFQGCTFLAMSGKQS
jgi:hypothetical protein